MSATKQLPRHGTRARYRLEIKPAADGTRGVACDRCKAANTKAVAAARAQRAANLRRTGMHIVEDVAAVTGADTIEASGAASAGKPGPMLLALKSDLVKIAQQDKVPFHDTLVALAEQLAQDADSEATPTARAAARRQLFEVLKLLQTRKDGDGNTALDIVLQDFGLPPVSVDASEVRHSP